MANQEFERVEQNEVAGRSHVAGETQLERALAKIRELTLDGLAHGFFEVTISSVLIKGEKREITICAGKSYRLVIPPNEVPD